MLDLDVTPQEGMVFHCAGQGSGESRVFDIWELPGAFDQFLRKAARLIAKDPHSADVLFNYLDPEEGRVYNDLARRIRKRFEELKSELSKRRDRHSVPPLANLMPE